MVRPAFLPAPLRLFWAIFLSGFMVVLFGSSGGGAGVVSEVLFDEFFVVAVEGEFDVRRFAGQGEKSKDESGEDVSCSGHAEG